MGKGQETREHLLKMSMAEFAECGYRGATLRSIAARAGVTAALFIYHFETKEKLADEVIKTVRDAMKFPTIPPIEIISSDAIWRSTLKAYVTDVIMLFTSSEYPLNYLAPLYRHESATISDKSHTIHDACLAPIFSTLEKLVALGVPDRDKCTIRLWSLALWNLMLAYALKDPKRIAQYVPEGFEPSMFKSMTIDFMLGTLLAPLKYTPAT